MPRKLSKDIGETLARLGCEDSVKNRKILKDYAWGHNIEGQWEARSKYDQEIARAFLSALGRSGVTVSIADIVSTEPRTTST